jgi:hypothetical protein
MPMKPILNLLLFFAFLAVLAINFSIKKPEEATLNDKNSPENNLKIEPDSIKANYETEFFVLYQDSSTSITYKYISATK